MDGGEHLISQDVLSGAVLGGARSGQRNGWLVVEARGSLVREKTILGLAESSTPRVMYLPCSKFRPTLARAE